MVKEFVARTLMLCLDAEDAGGGGGTENLTADNNGTTESDVKDGTQKPLVAAKPGAAPDKSADDARYKGILADLKKERQARQQYDTDLKAARTELEQERRRIQALVGVTPKSQEETDEELVRQRLGKIIPGLEGLTAEDIKAIREMRSQVEEMRQASNQQWTSHGRKMLDSVTGGIEKSLGGTLSERQANRIKRAYVAECESDPEFLARHESGDSKLVDEFVKGWIEDFVEPAKRQALAGEVSRQRRVPSGKDRSVVGHGDKKIDVTNEKAVEDFLVKSYREKGGSFGR